MGLRHPHKPSEYPSLLLFILDQTHITVTLATAAVLLWTRNPHVAWFSIGALSATQLAKGIKLLIRESRPPPPPPHESKPSPVRPKKTFGMPSTHATALSFYHGYLFPLIPVLTPYIFPSVADGHSRFSPLQARLPLQLALSVSWFLGLWSRKTLGYHTGYQIFVGAVIGHIMAMIWRVLWNSQHATLEPFLSKWIEWGWAVTLGRIF